jgi:hypothetical protein
MMNSTTGNHLFPPAPNQRTKETQKQVDAMLSRFAAATWGADVLVSSLAQVTHSMQA